jgi:hypothetical protein
MGDIAAFPGAKPDDGLLEIGVVTSGLLAVVRALAHGRRKGQSSPFVETARGRKFDVRFAPDVRARRWRSQKGAPAVKGPFAVTVCVPEAKLSTATPVPKRGSSGDGTWQVLRSWSARLLGMRSVPGRRRIQPCRSLAYADLAGVRGRHRRRGSPVAFQTRLQPRHRPHMRPLDSRTGRARRSGHAGTSCRRVRRYGPDLRARGHAGDGQHTSGATRRGLNHLRRRAGSPAVHKYGLALVLTVTSGLLVVAHSPRRVRAYHRPFDRQLHRQHHVGASCGGRPRGARDAMMTLLHRVRRPSPAGTWLTWIGCCHVPVVRRHCRPRRSSR